MRQSWTDDRMDDLSRQVAAGFDRVEGRFGQIERQIELTNRRLDAEIYGLRLEMNTRFEHVERRFEHFDQQFGRIDQRLDGLHRAVIFGSIAMTGAILAGFGGIITTLG